MHRVRSKRAFLTARGSLAARARVAAFTLIELVVVIIIIAALASMIVSNVDTTTKGAESLSATVTMQTVAEAFTGSPTSQGYLADMKHVPGFPIAEIKVRHLFTKGAFPEWDPLSRRGWRGPYLRNVAGVQNVNTARNGAFPASDEKRSPGDTTFMERGFFATGYGAPGDPAVADPWGNPIVLQVPPESAFENSISDAKRFRYARLVSGGPDGVLSTRFDERLAGMTDTGDTEARKDDVVLFLNRQDIYETEEP